MTTTSQDKNVNDKRLQERFSLLLPVRVSMETETGVDVQFEGVIANISSGGAFITTDKPLPVSSKIYLEFLISTEERKKLKFILSFETLRHFQGGGAAWVKASGIIIRHENKGMAIIFDDDYQLSPLHTAGN